MIRPKVWNFDLDIKRKTYMTNITPKQGDIQSNVFRINLFQGAEVYDLTGLSVKAYFKRPDEAVSFIDGVVTGASEGKVEITLTNQILNLVGAVQFELLILGTDGEALSTVSFSFKVLSSLDYTEIESTNEFNALVTALGEVQNIDNRFNSVNAQLAENAKKTNGIVCYTQSPFNAAVDGVTDDTQAIRDCIAYAKANNLSLLIPHGTALVSDSLDVTGLHVWGVGDISKIKATSAQFDVMTTGGNTILEDFILDGSWDGVTAGQLGDTISVKNTVTNTPYNVHFKKLRIQNNKNRGIYIERGGYSSIESCKINVSGLHGIELYSPNGGEAITTIKIYGQTTTSDCPYGYGLKETNGVNISLDGVIIEYTKGIELAGNDNRSISLQNVYQENTVGGKFVTLTGSGQGLVISGCFGGSSKVSYSPNWHDVHIFGNSSLESSAITFNSRVLSADGGEVVTAATGSFTAATLTLPPGTWRIHGALQIVDASGGATVSELSAEVTTDVASTGRNIATNADFNFGAECVSYAPNTQANLRVSPFKYYVNTTEGNIVFYLRGRVVVTSGSIAYKGQLFAEKL